MASITGTKNYKLFKPCVNNRPLDLKKHRALVASMNEYGFLPCYPIVCFRDESSGLVVKDGQHRLAVAEKLGLSVFYTVTNEDFDVAEVNGTIKTWLPDDYAQCFSVQDVASYVECLSFAKLYHVTVGMAACMLAGTTTFKNIQDDFRSGKFKVKDRKFAYRLASVFCSLTSISRRLRTALFLQACMGVCRIDGIDIQRLISNADRCPEKLLPFGTRESLLQMLEEVYNFGHHKTRPLKFEAEEVMKSRNAKGKKAKANQCKEDKPKEEKS